MSLSELEKLYMPSHWSKRNNHEQLLEQYFKFCKEITAEVRSTINNELDIPYGNTKNTKYDIYGKNLPNDAPILVFIHGGYWQEFSKDMSGFSVPNFVANGIKVIVAGYDLCPDVTLTEIVEEIKLLVQKVLEMAYNLGSKCVWIAGHSAGAHLAACLLHEETWFSNITRHNYQTILKGLCLIGGIYNLEPLTKTSVNDAVRLTNEEIKTFTLAPINETLEQFHNLQHRDIKVIVTVGECDSPIFIEESRRYSRVLSKFVDNVEFILIRNNIDHFDIVENLVNHNFVLARKLVQDIKKF